MVLACVMADCMTDAMTDLMINQMSVPITDQKCDVFLWVVNADNVP